MAGAAPDPWGGSIAASPAEAQDPWGAPGAPEAPSPLLPVIDRLENSDAAAAAWNKAHPGDDRTADSIVSPAGAVGRYQVTPATAKSYGLDPAQLTNPAYNAMAANVVLSDLSRRYGGDQQAVAVAYNAGPGVADRWLKGGRKSSLLPPETRAYIAHLQDPWDGAPLAPAGIPPGEDHMPVEPPGTPQPPSGPAPARPSFLADIGSAIAEPWQNNPVMQLSPDELQSIMKLPEWARPYAYDVNMLTKLAGNTIASGMAILPRAAVRTAEALGVPATHGYGGGAEALGRDVDIAQQAYVLQSGEGARPRGTPEAAGEVPAPAAAVARAAPEAAVAPEAAAAAAQARRAEILRQIALAPPEPKPAAPEAVPSVPSPAVTAAGLPGRPVGQDVAITTAGREVPVRYAIVDAGDLVPSQTETGAVNPAYPAELQPRDRTRAVSQNQVAQIAQNLNPRLLDRTTSAGDGAPIVSSGGIVESGNGRTLAVQRAYREGLPAANAYREYLAAQGYPVEGMKAPMLVRIREGDLNPEERQAFVREANQSAQLGYSATEQAMVDAAALPDDALSQYRGGDIESAANRDFVRSYLRSAVPANDQAAMVDKEGALSQDAIRRIRNGLFAKAYGDPDLTAKIAESPDSNIKAIGGALADAAPEWAKMRAAAARGAIPADLDDTSRLLEAARLVARARAQGQKIGDLVNQNEMFGARTIDPDTEAWLRLMYRDTSNWTSPVGREKLSDALRHYAVEAQKVQPGPNLFGTAPPSSAELLAGTKAKQESQYAGGEQQRLAQEAAPFAGPGVRPHGGERGEAGVEDTAPQGGAGAAQTGAAPERSGLASDFSAPPTFWSKAAFGAAPAGRETDLGVEARAYVTGSGSGPVEGLSSYVHNRGITTGDETLAALERDGQIHASSSGEKRFVAFSPKVLKALRDADAGVITVHNHPSSGAFSAGDLASLAMPGHKWMTVVGHNGDWYAARLSDGLRDFLGLGARSAEDTGKAIADAHRAASNVVHGIFEGDVREGRLDPDKAAIYHWNAVSRALERAGLLDYLTTADRPPGYPGIGAHIERAADAAARAFDSTTGGRAAERLARDRRAGEGPYTWPEPVRFRDGVARIFGEPGEAAAGSPGGAVGTAGVRNLPARKPEQLSLFEGQAPGAAFDQALDTPLVRHPGLREEPEPYTPTGQESSEVPPPPPPPPPAAGRGLGGWLFGKFQRNAPDAASRSQTIWHDAKMLVSPMTAGPGYAQAVAKDFANAGRLARDYAQFAIKRLTRSFTPADLKKMWLAADEQSIALQRGESTTGVGLDRLEPRERAAVEEMQRDGEAVFAAARELGMVRGEGIPSYVPHLAVEMATAGPKQIGEPSVRSIPGIGRNLRTAIPQLRGRKYETAEEMEQALARGTGKDVQAVRDIRTLPYITGRLREAVAGRAFINAIKDFSKQVGDETVVEGASPGQGWFTLNHPSFFTWRPKFVADSETGKTVAAIDQNGDTVFEKVPIFVHPDWEGPVKAVLSQEQGALYRGMMQLKGKVMNNIMFSPLVQLHMLTEMGRSLPVAPLRVATGKILFDGFRAKNDPLIRREAVMNGMVPIGHRGAYQDITSFAAGDVPQSAPSWTARVVGAVPGLFDRATGAATQDAVYKAVAAAGNFLHNTMLWDRVADLQFGLYTTMKDYAMSKGLSEQAAGYLAAHWANRYAGTLPIESMSAMARKIANIMLFSRSYTMGNWGVFKDMVNGLPQDVRAQMARDVGAAEARKAVSLGKRKAIGVVALDVALMYAGNSILQNFFSYASGRQTGDQIAQGYVDRWHKLESLAATKPLAVLNPFDDMGRLSATADNEIDPDTGRPLNRILVGYQKDGTAVYARNPLGKFGEEINNWTEAPGKTLLAKLSTFAKPTYNVIVNDKGFGRHVYNANDSTMQTAAKIVGQYMQAQLPMDQLTSLGSLLEGSARALDVAKLAGRTVGVTFRKGAPGGPAVGEFYRLREATQQEREAKMPGVIEMIKDRDFAGAKAAMRALSIPPREQDYYIRTTLNPRLRMSTQAAKRLLRSAPPEERERILKLQENSQ